MINSEIELLKSLDEPAGKGLNRGVVENLNLL